MDPQAPIPPLYYLIAVTGLIMMVGGLWLVYKEKIYLDPKTGQPSEVEVPWLGKFKTNVPALALFVIGLVPLLYPLYLVSSRPAAAPGRTVTIKGRVNSRAFPVDVYAVSDFDVLNNRREFSVRVPVAAGADKPCRIVYLCGTIRSEELADLSNPGDSVIKLGDKEFGTPGGTYAQDAALSDVPAEFRRD